jgi:hypothetical protein
MLDCEGPIPNNCPSCKNIRWNRKYTKSESELFGQVQMQHILNKYLVSEEVTKEMTRKGLIV